MVRWSNEKTIQLIHLYRQHECLWNRRSLFYKDKAARESAYESILQLFNDPTFDKNGLRIKIKNLRSLYHTELRKVRYVQRCGRDTGAEYQPCLVWFPLMHAFLEDSADSHVGLLDYVSAQVPSPRTPDDSSQASSQDPLVKLITFETKIEQTLDPLQDSHTTEATLADSQTGTVTVTTSSEPQHTNKIKAIKRKVFRRTRPYVDNTLMNALHRLESTVSELVTAGQSQEQPTGAQPEDEFHMFALSVAAQLRQLPLHVAITTQSKIQSTLTEARLTSLFPAMLSPPAVCTVKTEDITIE